MALPKIVWNGNTLTFPRRASGWTPIFTTNTTQTVSGAGMISATRFFQRTRGFRVLVPMLTDAAIQQFYNWWFWASSAGSEFAVAFDGDKTLDTTLDAAANSGQTTVPLTATTGVVAGDELLLVSADRARWEIIEVATVSAGASVTATRNLTNSFVLGDSCTHFLYLPNARLEKANAEVVDVDDEGETNAFDLDFTVTEYLEG